MKSKQQKQKELEKGRELLRRSKTLIFVDFSSVPTKEMRVLKREMGDKGAKLMVLKKRLLGLLLTERKLPFDPKTWKLPMATVFAENIESASVLVHKFFSTLGGKDTSREKILGGYDLRKGEPIPAEEVRFLGALPPREVLLAQLLGMIAAPIRSFLYILKERSKQVQ